MTRPVNERADRQPDHDELHRPPPRTREPRDHRAAPLRRPPAPTPSDLDHAVGHDSDPRLGRRRQAARQDPTTRRARHRTPARSTPTPTGTTTTTASPAGRRPTSTPPGRHLADHHLPGRLDRGHDLLHPPDTTTSRGHHAAARSAVDTASRADRIRSIRVAGLDRPRPLPRRSTCAWAAFLSVEDFPEARVPAWKLTIDFGSGARRQAILGADHARTQRDELLDTLVIAVVNFPARQIGPVRSEVLVARRARRPARRGTAGVRPGRGDRISDRQARDDCVALPGPYNALRCGSRRVSIVGAGPADPAAVEAGTACPISGSSLVPPALLTQAVVLPGRVQLLPGRAATRTPLSRMCPRSSSSGMHRVHTLDAGAGYVRQVLDLEVDRMDRLVADPDGQVLVVALDVVVGRAAAWLRFEPDRATGGGCMSVDRHLHSTGADVIWQHDPD